MDMDMGHEHTQVSGLGMETNYAFARDFWYIIAGVLVGLTAVRGINYYTARQR